LKLVVSEEIFAKFSGAVIGIVLVRGIDNSGASEELTQLIRNQEEKIRAGFNIETLSENPKIASWREAYRAFGAKPKKHRCSAENLYRMILEGENLRGINKLVDAYNLVSITHLIPAGGDDTDKVEGDIRLKFAEGNERFVELNAREGEAKAPEKGEVVYVDDKDVLCRRWNWRECDKTKMTSETRNAVLVVEGLPPFSRDDVLAVANELASLVKRFCGGETRALVLDKEAIETGDLAAIQK